MLGFVRSFFQSLLTRFLGNPLVRRVIRNTGYLFSAQTLSAAMSFGQGILTARLLGVEGAGYVGIVTQFSSNINRLISFRMSELVINYLGEFTANDRKQHAAAVFKAAALVEIGGSVVAYLLVIVLSPLGAAIFAHNPGLAGLFALYGLSVLANLMYESATGLLHFFNRFRTVALISVGQSLLTLILIFVAFSMRQGIEAIILAYLVGKIALAVGVSVAALWQAQREWGLGWWRAPLSLLSEYRKELVRFAVSTNISGTLKLVTRDSEMLWLGAFSTPLQVGYYKIAKAIMNILMMPVTPLVSTTYREIAREVAERHWNAVRYLLRSGTLLAAAYTLPAGLGLILFGRWVVSIYGPSFLPVSYHNILILLIGVIPVNIFYWNQVVLLPLGLPQFPTQVLFVAAVIKVVGTFLLVPTWGANGMAALLSGFFLLTTIVLVWRSLRELQRAELRPVLATGD
ncbi:MAG: oligosaccharide flippase family protein [Anaerolineales bacterium]|nr:oligosaccharide flippase family protein [Anaerolineales bacterium]